jgi:hypothetical protein
MRIGAGNFSPRPNGCIVRGMFDPDDDVVPLGPRRNPWPRPKGSNGVPIAVADGVIAIMRASGYDLRLSGGDLHIREAGAWRRATRADLQHLRCLTHQGVEALGAGAKVSIVTASWRRLLAHPGLLVLHVARDEMAATTRPPPAETQVEEWVRKALLRDDMRKVSRNDMVHSFRGWQRSEFGDDVRLLDAREFFPQLHRVCAYVTLVKVKDTRYAAGVVLNAEGLRYWQQHRGLGSRGLAFSTEYVNLVWNGCSNVRAFKPAAPPDEALLL